MCSTGNTFAILSHCLLQTRLSFIRVKMIYDKGIVKKHLSCLVWTHLYLAILNDMFSVSVFKWIGSKPITFCRSHVTVFLFNSTSELNEFLSAVNLLWWQKWSQFLATDKKVANDFVNWQDLLCVLNEFCYSVRLKEILCTILTSSSNAYLTCYWLYLSFCLF